MSLLCRSSCFPPSRPPVTCPKSRPSTGKSARTAPASTYEATNGGQHSLPTSGIPENAAVHFAKFYADARDESLNFSRRKSDARGKGFVEFPRNDGPKIEFTKLMLHKLQKLAGTEDYARQVSAVLEETVEPPGFKVAVPPADNCIPYGDLASSYPLWFRDPCGVPHREAAERYRSIGRKNTGLSSKTMLRNNEAERSVGKHNKTKQSEKRSKCKFELSGGNLGIEDEEEDEDEDEEGTEEKSEESVMEMEGEDDLESDAEEDSASQSIEIYNSKFRARSMKSAISQQNSTTEKDLKCRKEGLSTPSSSLVSLKITSMPYPVDEDEGRDSSDWHTSTTDDENEGIKISMTVN